MAGFQGMHHDAALPSRAAVTAEIDLVQLQPSPSQPRRIRSLSDIAFLADSIRQVGILEPLCVRPLQDDCYEIIAGERRWRAARLAGLERVPCRVYEVTEDQAFVLALAENIQREALSPLEEAMAYQQMLDRGIARNRAAIARMLGVTRPRITQKMKLLELDSVTQQKLEQHSDVLTEKHGRLLWEIKCLPDRLALVEDAISGHWSAARLEIAVRKSLEKRDIDEWGAIGTSVPRVYRVSCPGLHVTLNLRQADLHRALETAERMAALIRRRISCRIADQDAQVLPLWRRP
jgi:ParB family chromosome partitioning protein